MHINSNKKFVRRRGVGPRASVPPRLLPPCPLPPAPSLSRPLVCKLCLWASHDQALGNSQALRECPGAPPQPWNAGNLLPGTGQARTAHQRPSVPISFVLRPMSGMKTMGGGYLTLRPRLIPSPSKLIRWMSCTCGVSHWYHMSLGRWGGLPTCMSCFQDWQQSGGYYRGMLAIIFGWKFISWLWTRACLIFRWN